jgi:hypothetical protein
LFSYVFAFQRALNCLTFFLLTRLRLFKSLFIYSNNPAWDALVEKRIIAKRARSASRPGPRIADSRPSANADFFADLPPLPADNSSPHDVDHLDIPPPAHKRPRASTYDDQDDLFYDDNNDRCNDFLSNTDLDDDDNNESHGFNNNPLGDYVYNISPTSCPASPR